MKMTWHVCVLTLFPEMFQNIFEHSIAGKALKANKWQLDCINIRDFSHLKHQKVDDKPFGGGPGLIMRCDVIDTALSHANQKYKNAQIIYLSPQGIPFKHIHAENFIQKDLIILCGRYEGIDERVIDHWKQKANLKEVSIGDFVLSGGEIPSMTIIDACVRLLPSVLENQDTIKTESFSQGLLEYPQYTKPRIWKEKHIPEILLSGNHGEIKKWQQEQSVQKTKKNRPDLLKS